jgi:SAM-dependent methyltransferase
MTSSSPQGRFWDTRYAEPGFAFGREPNRFLASQSALIKSGTRALIPGDGEGRNGVWLARQGLRVTSVDASEVGVAKARSLAQAHGVTIDAICADLTGWAWPRDEFDLVASIYVHFPAADRAAMHRAMFQALRPGGHIVLEGYTPRQLAHRERGTTGGPADPAMLFEPEQLRTDFAGAQILHLEEVETDLSEGNRHVGLSSVVRLVARQQ